MLEIEHVFNFGKQDYSCLETMNLHDQLQIERFRVWVG